MTELVRTIEVGAQLRPCVAHGVNGLFHKWVETSDVIPPSALRGGHSGGVVRTVAAVVELEGGNVVLINHENIRFLDSPFNDFDFTEGGRAK